MSASLLRPDFRFMSAPSLGAIAPDEWRLIQRQRTTFHRELAATQLLAMLRAGAELPTYGYRLNNYQHCLQTATMMAKAGYDEEDVVVGLFHDIAFVVAPEQHGSAAAMLLKGVTSERNQWMLEHHAVVGEQFLPDDKGAWRELRHHEHFAWTEEFVERFDLRAIDPGEQYAPLEDFESTVTSVFASRLGKERPDPSAAPEPDRGMPR